MESLYSGFLDNKLVRVIKDTLTYDWFEFIKIKKYYKSKNQQNYIIFRRKNYRKDEHIRKGKARYCDAKIELIFKKDNKIN